jgi:hypothetical protein
VARRALAPGTAKTDRDAYIDLDGTDVECYESGEEGIAYTYKGERAGRPHVATWAEAGLVTAADLLAGDEDPRPGAAGLPFRVHRRPPGFAGVAPTAYGLQGAPNRGHSAPQRSSVPPEKWSRSPRPVVLPAPNVIAYR